MAWEWLEKYLRGKAPISTDMVQPGTGEIMESGVQQSGTQGLFGTGGQYGTGGLLTTFNQPSNPGKGMLDLFSNLPAVTGMEIIQGGIKGKPIEETLLPAFKTSLKTTTAVESVKAAKRKRDYINKYKDQVPEGDMELFLAFPEKYISAKLQKDLRKETLGDRALAIVDKLSKLSAKDQEKALRELKKTDPVAYDIYKKFVKGGFTTNDIIAMLLGGGTLLKDQTNQTDQTQTIPGTGYEKGQKIKLATGEEGEVVEVDDEGRILKVKPIKK
jgi:hypothetical protein